MKALPTQPVKNEDGSWSGPGQEAQWYGSIRNPIGTLYMMTNETKGYNFWQTSPERLPLPNG